MKHTIEITTIEGMNVCNALRCWIEDYDGHPLDKQICQQAYDKIKSAIAKDLPPSDEMR